MTLLPIKIIEFKANNIFFKTNLKNAIRRLRASKISWFLHILALKFQATKNFRLEFQAFESVKITESSLFVFRIQNLGRAIHRLCFAMRYGLSPVVNGFRGTGQGPVDINSIMQEESRVLLLFRRAFRREVRAFHSQACTTHILH